MAQVGQLWVELGLDQGAFRRGLATAERAGREWAGRVGSTLRDAFSIAGAMLLVDAFRRGISSLTDAFVGAASEAEETQNKFNVVFGALAAQANQWAEGFARAVGRSRQDIKAWMAELQDTFVPLGFSREMAYELSRALVQLAVDVASFNNVADAEVIRNFTSAIVGNHEAVRRYGIVITEAAIKQEAMRLGLGKSLDELTEQQKALVRFSIILNSSKDAMGDAIRTADSYANTQKRIQARIKDLRAEIGRGLLPAMAAALRSVEPMLDRLEVMARRFAEAAQAGGIMAGLRAVLPAEAFAVLARAVEWASRALDVLRSSSQGAASPLAVLASLGRIVVEVLGPLAVAAAWVARVILDNWPKLIPIVAGLVAYLAALRVAAVVAPLIAVLAKAIRELMVAKSAADAITRLATAFGLLGARTPVGAVAALVGLLVTLVTLIPSVQRRFESLFGGAKALAMPEIKLPEVKVPEVKIPKITYPDVSKLAKQIQSQATAGLGKGLDKAGQDIVDRIASDLEKRVSKARLEMETELLKLRVAGVPEEAPQYRQAQIAGLRRVHDVLQAGMDRLRAALKGATGELLEKGTLKLLELQKESLEVLLQIQENTRPRMPTFGLPGGVRPMTLFEARAAAAAPGVQISTANFVFQIAQAPRTMEDIRRMVRLIEDGLATQLGAEVRRQ